MGKKKQQPTPAEEQPEEESEEEVFVVEVVTAARVVEGGEWEYKVKWDGYGSEDATWEPSENLHDNNDRLLKSFWNHVGLDDRDWPVGTICEAKPSWIKKERQYFKMHIDESDKDKKKKQKEKERKKKQHSAITVSASNKQPPLKKEKERLTEATKSVKKFVEELNTDDEDSDETPLSNVQPTTPTTKPPAKKSKPPGAAPTRRVMSDSESDDDEIPLSQQPQDKGKGKAKEQTAGQKRKSSAISKDTKEGPTTGKGNSAELPRKVSKVTKKSSVHDSAVAGPSNNRDSSVETTQKRLKATGSKSEPQEAAASSTANPSTSSTSKTGLKIAIPTVSPRANEKTPPQGDATRTPSPHSAHSLFSGTDTSPAKHPPASANPQLSNQPAAKVIAKGDTVRKDSKADPHKIQAGSTLPTKQRLAEANVLMNPKAMKSAKASPVVGSGQGSLSTLTFKKNKSMSGAAASPVTPVAPSPVVRQDPRLSVAQAGPSSPVAQVQTTGATFVRSPSPMQVSDNEGRSQEIDLPSSISRIVRPSALNTAVDDFLASIPINDEPLIDGVNTSADKVPSYPLPSANASGPYRIPKKFKWAGEVFMHTEKDRAEKLFEGTLSEEPPKQTKTLRFSYCIGEKVDSLRLMKLLHVSELPMLQAACNQVSQLGRLEPKEDKDHDAFGTLIKYMTPRQLVTYAPLYLADGSPCGMLLLFPSVSEALCDIFKPSLDLKRPNGFIAVLYPWAVPGKVAKTLRTQYRAEERSLVKAPSVFSNPDPVKVSDRSHSLRIYPSYHRALHILQFPNWLHRHMSQADRKYALVFEPSDGKIGQESSEFKEEWRGSETRALQTILKRCGAQRVHLKDDKLRAIFVHVGSLVAFQKFSHLARKRKKWPWVQFFTYGTHETVGPERWGVHEIYPLGGIVTFTPAVFRDNHPQDMFKFINKVKAHPLWDCYILPSTVAMVVRDACGSDPSGALDSSRGFVYEDLFKMIKNGKLALLTQPPFLPNDAKGITDWASSQLRLFAMDERGILQFCLRNFMKEYENIDEEKWPFAVKEEVLSSLSSMQVQPSIMKNYRRFVVLRGRLEYEGKEDKKDFETRGAEWTTLSDFEWKDDFFSGDLAPAMSGLNLGL